MHQTFYIDVNEEISSVIDRLNKSMSIDNYFVVPKRALFLQSIVNLKILKREADKVSKYVIIVTQDEIAAAMAERVGIEVRASLEDSAFPAPETNGFQDEEQEKPEDEFIDNIDAQEDLPVDKDKQIRLSNVGSGDYYQSDGDQLDQIRQQMHLQPSEAAQRSVTDGPSKLKIFSGLKSAPEKPETIVLKKEENFPKKLPNNAVQPQSFPRSVNNIQSRDSIYKRQLDPQKAQSLEKMFSKSSGGSVASKPNQQAKQDGNGKIKKAFALFMTLCIIVLVGLGVYLFVPSAKITITANVTNQKIDADVSASTSVAKADQANIPLRAIDQEEQISLPYNVTGQVAVAGKKASGNVTIYNEYSSDSQTLLATTRIQSADGKIFHLVRSVVVPGSSTVGGQAKAGAVQASVVADQAGADYNIDPTKFTIPGFANGPKFDKFYANSTLAMSGGTTDGQQASGAAVSQADFDGAKQKTEAALNDKLNSDIAGQLASGEIALPQAEKINVEKSAASVKLGSTVSTFNWVVTGSVHALIFSENDVRNIISQSPENNQQSPGAKQDITKIDYASVEPDFDANTLELKVFGQVTTTPTIDSAQIKNELLGKSDDQLADILKKYTSIKNANVEFSPTFITRIPQYPQRVSIDIKTDAQ